METDSDKLVLYDLAAERREDAKRASSSAEVERTLADEIARFDITRSTPVECMNFIAGLKKNMQIAVI